MTRPIMFAAALAVLCVSPSVAQINESKEFPGVYHSPAADATPPWHRSVLQMEVVVKKAEAEAEIQYANGTVVSRDGLIISVLDAPGTNQAESGGIQSASVLLLDGSGAAVELVAYEPDYGVAVFRAQGLDLRPLRLSEGPVVANRRVTWHTVFKQGRKTYLYTRPLQVHKAAHQIASSEDLIEIVDPGSSSLNADRSGSALVTLDGTLLAVMGIQEHWNVTPKNALPRKKLAWAVPADVIARILATNESN